MRLIKGEEDAVDMKKVQYDSYHHHGDDDMLQKRMLGIKKIPFLVSGRQWGGVIK